MNSDATKMINTCRHRDRCSLPELGMDTLMSVLWTVWDALTMRLVCKAMERHPVNALLGEWDLRPDLQTRLNQRHQYAYCDVRCPAGQLDGSSAR
jgi:hypothetical protein